MVYLIKKLNQKPCILTFGHIEQINLNTSNFINDFFTSRKMVFLTTQIEQTNWATKKYITKF
jgi:hypothetical protein